MKYIHTYVYYLCVCVCMYFAYDHAREYSTLIAPSSNNELFIRSGIRSGNNGLIAAQRIVLYFRTNFKRSLKPSLLFHMA